jgi:hypothetical protein
MALRVLEGLPAAIRLALADAYARGRREGRVEAPRPSSRAVWRPRPKPAPAKGSARPTNRSAPNGSSVPAFAKLAAELAGHVAALGADAVAEALGVGLDDLGPLLKGRVAPPASGMRRLRERSE